MLPGKVGQGGRSEFLLFCFESRRRREGGAPCRGGCRALCGRAAAKGSSPGCLGDLGVGGRLGAGAQGKRTRSPPAVETSRSSLPPPLQDRRKSHPSPHSAPSSSLHSLWRKDNAATPALPRSSMSVLPPAVWAAWARPPSAPGESSSPCRLLQEGPGLPLTFPCATFQGSEVCVMPLSLTGPLCLEVGLGALVLPEGPVPKARTQDTTAATRDPGHRAAGSRTPQAGSVPPHEDRGSHVPEPQTPLGLPSMALQRGDGGSPRVRQGCPGFVGSGLGWLLLSGPGEPAAVTGEREPGSRRGGASRLSSEWQHRVRSPQTPSDATLRPCPGPQGPKGSLGTSPEHVRLEASPLSHG